MHPWLRPTDLVGMQIISQPPATGNDTPTEPGRLSLMGDIAQSSAHIDPANKLALGWVDPLWIEQGGQIDLLDVKVGEEVMILPRHEGGDGKEYYIVENRQTTNMFEPPLYDKWISDSGVAVWHVVLDDALNANAPNCIAQVDWNNWTSGSLRRGVRLLRPTMDPLPLSSTLWSDAEYDLLDAGVVCNPNPALRRNALTWADGNPSGYQLLDFSAPGELMSFFLVVP